MDQFHLCWRDAPNDEQYCNMTSLRWWRGRYRRRVSMRSSCAGKQNHKHAIPYNDNTVHLIGTRSGNIHCSYNAGAHGAVAGTPWRKGCQEIQRIHILLAERAGAGFASGASTRGNSRFNSSWFGSTACIKCSRAGVCRLFSNFESISRFKRFCGNEVRMNQIV